MPASVDACLTRDGSARSLGAQCAETGPIPPRSARFRHTVGRRALQVTSQPPRRADPAAERIVLGVERAALAVVRDPKVEIVVPVYNEERDLERSVRRLRAYLDARFPFHALVTIADNASTDGTQEIGEALASEIPGVHYMRIDDKGRGRALAAAWLTSRADIVAYMDVDLSTDLGALLPLVAPLVSGHSDLAIGSRLARGARVVRGPKRELISRCYNALLHAVLRVRFSDAQCGFKAIRADRARALLPLVQDRGWFFDTELLVLAERMGLRIHEVPVDWTEDPDSRVDIARTAMADLQGVARLARDLVRGRIALPEVRGPSFGGQVLRFAVIGVASTVAYLALYALLRTAVA